MGNNAQPSLPGHIRIYPAGFPNNYIVGKNDEVPQIQSVISWIGYRNNQQLPQTRDFNK